MHIYHTMSPMSIYVGLAEVRALHCLWSNVGRYLSKEWSPPQDPEIICRECNEQETAPRQSYM